MASDRPQSSKTFLNTYQMRVSSCERDRILWITSRTLVCHSTGYLNEFRASPRQIDQIQAQCVSRKFNLFFRRTKTMPNKKRYLLREEGLERNAIRSSLFFSFFFIFVRSPITIPKRWSIYVHTIYAYSHILW